MPITLVGKTGATSGNGADPGNTMPSGTTVGDTVLVFAFLPANASGAARMVSPGYSTLTVRDDGVSGHPSVGVYWKRITDPASDTSVFTEGTGASTVAAAQCLYVLRGVSALTVSDATPTFVAPVSGRVDPGAIVTQTSRAWVFAVVGAGGVNADQVATGLPSGYTQLEARGNSDTFPCGGWVGFKEVASAGTEDPGVFSGDAGSSVSQLAFTVAIRSADAADAVASALSAARIVSALPIIGFPRGRQLVVRTDETIRY